MAVKFANNVSTTLTSAINATQTTISVADASGLPSLSSGDYIYLTIDTDTASPTLEVVKVTAVSSNNLTVVRGQDGTTASSFSAGVKVELRVTAAALGDISSQAQTAADTESVSIAGDTMTGALTAPKVEVTGQSTTSAGETHTVGLIVERDVPIVSKDSSGYLRRMLRHITGGNLELGQGGTSLIQDIGLYPGSSGNVNFYTNNSNGTPVVKARVNSAGEFDGNSLRDIDNTAYYVNPNFGANINGTVSWSGGSSSNANTAYTYSQVGHLPLSGGTLTGTLNTNTYTPSNNTDWTNVLNINSLYIASHVNSGQQFTRFYNGAWTGYFYFNSGSSSGEKQNVRIQSSGNTQSNNKIEINDGTAWRRVLIETDKNSMALTGTPTAPTAVAGTNTTQIATTAYVTTAIDNIVDAAPGSLDTLNELAAALGDDANFSTTVTNSIATKLSKSGGTMTGNINMGANRVELGNVDLYASGDNNSLHIHAPTAVIPPSTTTANNPHLGLTTYRWQSVNAGTANFSGTVTAPYVRLTGTGDAALTSTTHGFQVGADSGQNVIIDNNEIISRNNGAASTLYLQNDGGTVHVGANISSSLIVDGTISGNTFTDRNNTAYFVNPAETGTSAKFAGNVNIGYKLAHVGDGDTALQFDTDRVRLIAGGVTKFDSNNTYLTTGSTIPYSQLSGTPSSLPASGGNADTVDNLHAASFLRSDADDTTSGYIAFSDQIDGVQFSTVSNSQTPTNLTSNNRITGGSDYAGLTKLNNIAVQTWYGFSVSPTISGYTVSQGSPAFSVDARNGIAYAARSHRSKVFYDTDDTAYYVNPADMSELKDLRTGKDHHTNSPRWDTSFYVAQSQHWYGHSASQTMLLGESANNVRLRGYLNVGSNENVNSSMRLTVRGHADATDSLRAPIFYDLDDTAYYTNPADTSVLNSINLGYKLAHNGDSDTYLQFDANRVRLFAGGNSTFDSHGGFREKVYTSGYSSTSGQWYTIFTISENTTPVYVTLKNAAHSTATFVVSTGYHGSNEADLTVLNSTWTQNGGYPGAQRVRVVKQSNNAYHVQVSLYWSSSSVSGFELNCRLWGGTPDSELPTFVSSLSAETGSPTVIREARCDLDRMNFSTVPYVGDNIMWHAGNDGPNSGLAADTLDGFHETTFMRKDANSSLDMNNYDITAVNRLTFNDPGVTEGIKWASGNQWQIYESPDNQTNAAGNLQFTSGGGNGTIRMTIDTSGNVLVPGDLKMTGTDSYIWTPNADNRYTGFWDARNSVVAMSVNTKTAGHESVTFGGNGGTTSSVWINTDNQNNYNGYNENIRLFNAGNGVSVIAFGAQAGTSNTGIPATSILGYNNRFETRVGNTWRQRIYGGYIEVNGSIRPDLMYDRNDTNYYVDPNGSSYIYNINLGGQAGRFEDKAYLEFYVHGNESTFYPVVIGGASEGYAYKDYSISRRYNWTAPDSWNTSTHKGGLTLTWQHSSDTNWGGNDKEWRVIQFDETYSQVCQGLELARTGGMVVWLRGGGTGGARYRVHSPKGSSTAVTIYDGVTSGTSGGGTHNSSTTFTDGSGTSYAAESANTTTRDNRINHRWPVRDRGYLYHNGSAVMVGTGMNDGADTYMNFRVMRNSNSTGHRDGMYIGYGNSNSGVTRLFGGGSTGNGVQVHSNYTIISGSTRSPIYYDLDSTSYYVNPASDSRVSRLLVGDGSNYIRIGDEGEGANTSYARMRTNSSGDLYLDAKDGRNIYLSWWTGTSARVYSEAGAQFPIYYDRNDTSYYVDPAGTSVLNGITFNGDVDFNGGANALNITNSDIRSDGTSNWTGNPGGDFKMQVHSERWYMVAGNGSNRIVQFRRDGTDTSYIANDGRLHGVGGSASQDWRAPIFYDSNNTGYYTDPASTSRMNVVWANSYAQDNNGIIKVMFPNGGSMDLGSGNTGAIKIRLPQSWTNTMMSLKITVYDYSTDESFDVRCGGYNHTNGSLHGGSWHNVFAWIDTNPNKDRNFTVRFGHDGTKCCIQIGETNSTWSYMDVTVTEFTGGHSQEEVAKWDDGWEVSLVTSNITMGSGSHTRTQTDRNRYMRLMYDIDNTGYYVDAASTSNFNALNVGGSAVWTSGNDGAGSGLHADLLDGYHGSHYLNYNNLSNKPSIPSVGNGTMTITAGSSLSGGGSFTANQSGNSSVTLSVAEPADVGGNWRDVVAWSGSALVKDASVEIHGSGYLRAVHINITHGQSTRNSDTIFYSSTDNYVRRNTAAGMRSSLDVYTKGEVNNLIPTIPSELPASRVPNSTEFGDSGNAARLLFSAGGNSGNRNYFAPRNAANNGWRWDHEFGYDWGQGRWYFDAEVRAAQVRASQAFYSTSTSSYYLDLDNTGTSLNCAGGITTAGNVSITEGHSTFNRTGNAPVILDRKGTTGSTGTSRGEILNFKSNSVKVGRVAYYAPYGGNLVFALGNTSGFGIGLYQFSTTLQINPVNIDGTNRDNAVDLGSSGGRYDDVYATNGTIQTSDRNEKQDIQALTDAEQRVATACKGLIRRFRWVDSVAEKGDDARYHFGAIAQDVEAAFTAEGLDAGDYGLFIRTTWWEHEGNSFPTAEAAPTGAVEKTRLGIRYNQLFAFIISTL